MNNTTIISWSSYEFLTQCYDVQRQHWLMLLPRVAMNVYISSSPTEEFSWALSFQVALSQQSTIISGKFYHTRFFTLVFYWIHLTIWPGMEKELPTAMQISLLALTFCDSHTVLSYTCLWGMCLQLGCFACYSFQTFLQMIASKFNSCIFKVSLSLELGTFCLGGGKEIETIKAAGFI